MAMANTKNVLENIVQAWPLGRNESKWPDKDGEYWGECPFHDDHVFTNFSLSERGYHCFACSAEGSLAGLAKHLGLHVCTDFGGDKHTHISSLTLAQYAEAKALPQDFLRDLGVEEFKRQDRCFLRMPYWNEEEQKVATRYRSALSGEMRFRWARDSHPLPYGLWRLSQAKEQGYILITEGESDAQTLWFHNLPALGIPGSSTWQPEWAEYVSDLTVFVWQEPDEGGKTFVERLGASLPEAQVILAPDGRKDISECHILGDNVPALLSRLMDEAQPWSEIQAKRISEEAREAWEKARELLEAPSILDEFVNLCRQRGLVGEERNAKLLYLAFNSRLLKLPVKPVSVCVKGPSSAGKNYLVENILQAFPDSAYYYLTSMSQRALAYSEEPLAHRMLVVCEDAGLDTDFATYLLRSLLSEGHLHYETVEKTSEGLKSRLMKREGPTGVILTTTRASLQLDIETRMLSLTVRDDPDQTKGIFRAWAERCNNPRTDDSDLERWHALQRWLELAGVREFYIPYAHTLAELASPKAVRLRRDFGVVLSLIGTHAILHQSQRERDERGRVVVTTKDYRIVHGLVIDTISEGVQASVSDSTRETVQAVKELGQDGEEPVKVSEVAKHLRLDHSAAWRRVHVAIQKDYLVNLEDRPYCPTRLVLGDPLPEEEAILPSPEALEAAWRKDMCVRLSPSESVQTCKPRPTSSSANEQDGQTGHQGVCKGPCKAGESCQTKI